MAYQEKNSQHTEQIAVSQEFVNPKDIPPFALDAGDNLTISFLFRLNPLKASRLPITFGKDIFDLSDPQRVELSERIAEHKIENISAIGEILTKGIGVDAQKQTSVLPENVLRTFALNKSQVTEIFSNLDNDKFLEDKSSIDNPFQQSQLDFESGALSNQRKTLVFLALVANPEKFPLPRRIVEYIASGYSGPHPALNNQRLFEQEDKVAAYAKILIWQERQDAQSNRLIDQLAEKGEQELIEGDWDTFRGHTAETAVVAARSLTIGKETDLAKQKLAKSRRWLNFKTISETHELSDENKAWNAAATQAFTQDLIQARGKANIDWNDANYQANQKLSLAKLHKTRIETANDLEILITKALINTHLTIESVIEDQDLAVAILASQQEILSRPDGSELTLNEQHIIDLASKLNQQDIYFFNYDPSGQHGTIHGAFVNGEMQVCGTCAESIAQQMQADMTTTQELSQQLDQAITQADPTAPQPTPSYTGNLALLPALPLTAKASEGSPKRTNTPELKHIKPTQPADNKPRAFPPAIPWINNLAQQKVNKRLFWYQSVQVAVDNTPATFEGTLLRPDSKPAKVTFPLQQKTKVMPRVVWSEPQSRTAFEPKKPAIRPPNQVRPTSSDENSKPSAKATLVIDDYVFPQSIAIVDKDLHMIPVGTRLKNALNYSDIRQMRTKVRSTTSLKDSIKTQKTSRSIRKVKSKSIANLNSTTSSEQVKLKKQDIQIVANKQTKRSQQQNKKSQEATNISRQKTASSIQEAGQVRSTQQKGHEKVNTTISTSSSTSSSQSQTTDASKQGQSSQKVLVNKSVQTHSHSAHHQTSQQPMVSPGENAYQPTNSKHNNVVGLKTTDNGYSESKHAMLSNTGKTSKKSPKTGAKKQSNNTSHHKSSKAAPLQSQGAALEIRTDGSETISVLDSFNLAREVAQAIRYAV